MVAPAYSAARLPPMEIGGTSSVSPDSFWRLLALGPRCGPLDPGGGAGCAPPPVKFWRRLRCSPCQVWRVLCTAS
eukprot:2851060-Amphidinium_carterae.1